MASTAAFRKCSICRDPIAFGAEYFLCSVSTCNKKRLPLFFCSLGCWDAHQAEARHRDAWAETERAPSQAEYSAGQRAEPQRAERAPAAAAAPVALARAPVVAQGASGRMAHEVLVVMSKLKEYVKGHSDMAVSDRVGNVLSDHLRDLADEAVLAAANDNRKTVLDRDVEPLVARRSAALGTTGEDDQPDTILVVVLKLKQYIRESSGMNTSDSIAPLLSGHLRYVARESCRVAAKNDRKTVLDRDATAVIEKLP